MRDKFFSKKQPHRTTFCTKHKFERKSKPQFQPKDSHRKEAPALRTDILFSPIDEDSVKSLSPEQKLVILFTITTLVSIAVLALQEQSSYQTTPLSTKLANTSALIPSASMSLLSSAQVLQTNMSHLLNFMKLGGPLKNCDVKRHGVTAGKICELKGKSHLMKAWESTEGNVDRFSNILLGMHNLLFAKENIGVKTPNLSLIHEPGGSYISSDGKMVSAEKYLASEFLEDFTNFDDLTRQTTRSMMKASRSKAPVNRKHIQCKIREQVIAEIGEHGLAKLAVSGTFIQDLVGNGGNWGIAKKELIIIDADHSPDSVEDHLIETVKMPSNIGIAFSIKTIEEMEKIYTGMKHKNPISFHLDVDFSMDEYQFLLDEYIRGCREALSTIKTTYNTLPDTYATSKINTVLVDAFKTRLVEYQREQNLVTKRYAIC